MMKTHHPADRTRRFPHPGRRPGLARSHTRSSAPSIAAEAAVKIPARPPTSSRGAGPQEVAVFAGGCFWGVQGVFQHTKGVNQAVSGYAGGSKQTAVYEMVGSGLTGHASRCRSRSTEADLVCAAVAGLLLGRARSDAAEPPVPTPARNTAQRLHDQRLAEDGREKYIAQLDAAKSSGEDRHAGWSADRVLRRRSYHQDYATLHPSRANIARFDLPKSRT